MSTPNSLKNRALIQNKDETGHHGNKFKVISYNVLAQCHMSRWDYSFTKCDSSFHTFEYRYGLMMEEVKYLDGDVVCLQEVSPQCFNILQPEMAKLGYEGHFLKRRTDYFDEGCATFYRTSAFTLLDSKTYYIGDLTGELFKDLDLDEQTEKEVHQQYIDRVDVLLITRLKFKSSDEVLTVANTHLTWVSVLKTDIRALQSRRFKQILSDYAKEHPSLCIWCGDFNSFPGSLAYTIAQGQEIAGSLESSLKTPCDKPQLLPVLQKAMNRIPADNLPLQSAYQVVMGKEPFPTHFDQDGTFTLDYIFYGTTCDRKLQPLSVLDVTPVSGQEKTLPPDQDIGSDHISVIADFCIC